jgi:hypothetical protein
VVPAGARGPDRHVRTYPIYEAAFDLLFGRLAVAPTDYGPSHEEIEQLRAARDLDRALHALGMREILVWGASGTFDQWRQLRRAVARCDLIAGGVPGDAEPAVVELLRRVVRLPTATEMNTVEGAIDEGPADRSAPDGQPG